MNMFQSFLSSMPKTRSDIVNDWEIPEVNLAPYVWIEPEESLSSRSDSVVTSSSEECDLRTLSTYSSIPLSRAMTDSEIDYGMHRRFKSRAVTEPWYQMRAALDAFPADYLASLNSFQNLSYDELDESITQERLRGYDDELRLKMERFFDEECRVFTADDPGLEELEDALQSIDAKILESELEPIAPCVDKLIH